MSRPWERQVKETVLAGAVVLAMLGQGTSMAGVPGPETGQQSTTGQQNQQQIQTIPDAPKPQTVPLAGVAPGKGTTTSSNGATVQPASDPDAPAAALPDSPQQNAADRDAGPPPDLPGSGDFPAYVIRQQVNFVDIPFTVKDNKGRLVPGITWRDVRVYENGLRQKMQVFTVDPLPMSVALVIDQSMPFDAMNRVNASLGALQGAFAPYDEVALFTYNNGPKLQVGYTAGQSALLAAVIERSKTGGRDAMYYAPGEALGGGIDINNHAQDNLTPLTNNSAPGGVHGIAQVPREVHTLNDAILAAAISLSKVPEPRRRIIYVISDGKEYGSTAKTKDVIRYLQTNKIAVYATLTGDSSVSGLGFLDKYHLPFQMRDNNLPAFTNATGGQTFAEFRTKGIEESFQHVTEQIRTQYTVGYYSREPFIDGKYRKIEVQIMRPNLQVIAKDGYYPTPERQRPPVPSQTVISGKPPTSVQP